VRACASPGPSKSLPAPRERRHASRGSVETIPTPRWPRKRGAGATQNIERATFVCPIGGGNGGRRKRRTPQTWRATTPSPAPPILPRSHLRSCGRSKGGDSKHKHLHGWGGQGWKPERAVRRRAIILSFKTALGCERAKPGARSCTARLGRWRCPPRPLLLLSGLARVRAPPVAAKAGAEATRRRSRAKAFPWAADRPIRPPRRRAFDPARDRGGMMALGSTRPAARACARPITNGEFACRPGPPARAATRRQSARVAQWRGWGCGAATRGTAKTLALAAGVDI